MPPRAAWPKQHFWIAVFLFLRNASTRHFSWPCLVEITSGNIWTMQATRFESWRRDLWMLVVIWHLLHSEGES